MDIWNLNKRRQLISQLSPFCWQSNHAISLPQQDYLAFYRLPQPSDDLDYRIGSVRVEQLSLVVQTWQPQHSRGIAIICHGYYDHTGLYGSLIRYCLDQQLTVLCIDLPGHGLSSGEPAVIYDFQQYDQVLMAAIVIAQELTQPIYVFGQSTGGAIIINHLWLHKITRNNTPFAGIVLLAPLVRPSKWATAKLLHAVVKYCCRFYPRSFHPSSQDPAFNRFVQQQDPMQAQRLSVDWVGALKQWLGLIETAATAQVSFSDLPILMIQGDNDQTVDWEFNSGFLQRVFPQLILKILSDGRHHLVNEIDELQDEMYQQITRHLKL